MKFDLHAPTNVPPNTKSLLNGPYLIFALALLLRVVIVVAYAGQMPILTDPDWYYHTAANAASGQGFIFYDHPTAFYAAGYSIVLTGFFSILGTPSILAAQLLNLVFSMLALYYGYRLVQAVMGERPARFALLYMALYPGFVGHSAMLLTEPLHMTFTLMGLYLLYQNPRNVIWGGLALAVATIVRPQMALIIPIFWLWCWLSHRLSLLETLRYGALCMLLALSLTGLWMLHNFLYLGVPVISTADGVNLWIGNGEGATGGYRFGLTAPPGLNEVELSRWYSAQALSYIQQHPLETLARIPAKLAALYRADDFPIWYLPMSFALGVLNELGIFVLLFLALLNIGLTLILRQKLATFAFIIPIATMITTAIFFGNGRFNLLACFWLAAFAVSFPRFKHKRSKPVASITTSPNKS